jgi:DNA-binding CsgD family transcriptional regulator
MAALGAHAMNTRFASKGDCLDSYRSVLAAVNSQAEATALLKAAIAPLGFTDFNYGCLNYYRSMASTQSPDWMARYAREGNWRSDRLVVAAQRHLAPFAAHDIVMEPSATVCEAQMESAIAAHFHALVVPIHCPLVGFSLAALFTGMDRDTFAAREPEIRGPATVMAFDYHEAVTRFYIGTETPHGRDGLTQRERQVLELASQGKTSDDIAGITGLAEATVNNHICRIMKKLKVFSRSQAIAEGQIPKPL